MTQIKQKKLLMVTCFLVVLVISVGIVVGALQLLKTWKTRFGTLYPQKTLVVSIDLGQREKLFEKLTEFADAHDFKIHIGPTTPTGDTFSIYMSRKDVVIWGDNVSSPRGEYNFSFYDEDPTNPAPEETIDNLYNGLKRYISEIPNVVLTEQYKSLQTTLDESQREEFFAQMRKLADEHSLQFSLSVSSDKSVFHIEIHGDGFHISSDPVVGSPQEISTIFFIDFEKAPTPASLDVVDKLFDELKNLLGDIPNVRMTGEK